MGGEQQTNFDAGEIAVLKQLDRRRPTHDGDIIGKAPRDSLIRRGLAFRAYGHTTLTEAGEVERILHLTDAEVIAEARRDGIDVEAEAARLRAMFNRIARDVRRAKKGGV
ncbi:hypothetical protein [Roseomonas chloroacetimidivorans]|uniref:hypothetical protein n=1 Tax=Roseomonas chloroacetimidivorans TaxID=1766656 RepID=UPI003C774E9C